MNNSKGDTCVQNLKSGNVKARVFQIVRLGTQYDETYKNYKKKIRFTWRVYGKDGGTGLVSREFTESLHPKSRYKPFMEKWMSGNTDNINLFKLLGSACRIQLVEKVGKNGNKYLFPDFTTPTWQGDKVPTLSKDGVFYDVDNSDESTYLKLPEFIKDKIRQSKEYINNCI